MVKFVFWTRSCRGIYIEVSDGFDVDSRGIVTVVRIGIKSTFQYHRYPLTWNVRLYC